MVWRVRTSEQKLAVFWERPLGLLPGPSLKRPWFCDLYNVPSAPLEPSPDPYLGKVALDEDGLDDVEEKGHELDHLQPGQVALPREVLLHVGPEGGQKVVQVHGHVDKRVEKGEKGGLAAWGEPGKRKPCVWSYLRRLISRNPLVPRVQKIKIRFETTSNRWICKENGLSRCSL